MENIVLLDRASIKAEFRRPSFPHNWAEHDATAPDEVVPRLADATIAVVNKIVLGRAEVDALPKLRMIAVIATGVDRIDLPACEARGIVVSNARDYATEAVPEHALMMMLALRRNLFAYRSDVLAGAWSRARTFCLFDHPIADLAGAKLGIIGYGALGRAMAKLGLALGMTVAVAERRDASAVRPGRTAFSDVLRQSDVVSLHAALRAETQGLIGARELALMKPSALLINTARGALVDAVALRDALLEGRIAWAGIDVLATEPPPLSNPLLEIAGRPNVIVTPHCAWASTRAMQNVADQTVESIEAFVRGDPRNVVRVL